MLDEPVTDPPDAPVGRAASNYPIWALICLVLGWAMVAASIGLAVRAVLILIGDDPYGFWSMLTIVVAAAYPGIAVGLALVSIARSGRRGPPSSWRLWAKLLGLLGGILAFSIPLAIYAGLRFGGDVVKFAREASGPPEKPALLEQTLGLTMFFGSVPFMFGVLLIVVSLVWGRRKPAET
jgi:hypothetical protein